MRTPIILITTLLLGSVASGIAHEIATPVVDSPAYDKMKALVGSWEGPANGGGKQTPASARFQLISDGSAIAAWLAEGTPHEMVTMFHMDGNQLMATHYCSAHNQPRLVLVAGSDPNRLVFKFKDGTNIRPHTGHMQMVTFIFDGPDRHSEEWTYLANGKEDTMRFDFHRKQ